MLKNIQKTYIKNTVTQIIIKVKISQKNNININFRHY